MSASFCSNCGSQIPEGYAFCSACGASQTGGAQQPTYQQPNQTGQQAYAPPPQAGGRPYQQSYAQSYQAGSQPYNTYQTGPQTGYGVSRVSPAKATGLIVGVFALVAAFILVVFVFILPSEKDFSLLGLTDVPQSGAPASSGPAQTQPPSVPASFAYGEPPASVLERVNVNAAVEDYSGSYTGKASFKSENLEIMEELTGDSSYSEILSKYNGKTYDCTAEVDDVITAFSPDIYSENEDGSFYTYYYYDLDLEDGIAVDEVSDYESEYGFTYYTADKAYLLSDGSIYVISIVSAQLDDGRSFASEIRLELTPAR